MQYEKAYFDEKGNMTNGFYIYFGINGFRIELYIKNHYFSIGLTYFKFKEIWKMMTIYQCLVRKCPECPYKKYGCILKHNLIEGMKNV